MASTTTSVNVEAINQNGKKVSRAFTYVNPAATDDQIQTAAQQLIALSNLTLAKTSRIQRTELGDAESTINRYLMANVVDNDGNSHYYNITNNDIIRISPDLNIKRIEIRQVQDYTDPINSQTAIFMDAFPKINDTYLDYEANNIYTLYENLTEENFTISLPATATYKAFTATITKEEE